jgi:hypothetical protein
MADVTFHPQDPQVKDFIAAFPEAQLDPTVIAESFKDTPECAPATRIVRLKTLHRAIPRQAGVTLSQLAKAYQFAPCLATLQPDRLFNKIAGADKLFGEGCFFPLFLQEPEKFGPLLQYQQGDFISLGLNCERAFAKLQLPNTVLPEMVMREPKLLGLEPTTLAAHMVELAKQAEASDNPQTLAALQKSLIETPSKLLAPESSLSFYLAPASAAPEPTQAEEVIAPPHRAQPSLQEAARPQKAPTRAPTRAEAPAKAPAPTSPKKALNAQSVQGKKRPLGGKLSTAGVISGSLAFASLQVTFSGQPKPFTRSDLVLLIKKI